MKYLKGFLIGLYVLGLLTAAILLIFVPALYFLGLNVFFKGVGLIYIFSGCYLVGKDIESE